MDKDKLAQFIKAASEKGLPSSMIKAFIASKVGGARDTLSQAGEAVGEFAGDVATGAYKILSQSGPITQKFGNRSAIEKYSKGVNLGTDIGVPEGTLVRLPPGEWQVVDAYDKAKSSGPGNPQGGINSGYGNSILVKNRETGEKLRFSHLSLVGVKPGQVLSGGTAIAKTGATGNVAGRTGQHLDLEYYDQSGKIRDVLQSTYRQYI